MPKPACRRADIALGSPIDRTTNPPEGRRLGCSSRGFQPAASEDAEIAAAKPSRPQRRTMITMDRITPKSLYLRRRDFLKLGAGATLLASTGALARATLKHG